MTLLLIFLIIGICLVLFGRASMSNQRRNSNRRGTDWPDQSSPTPMEHTNPGLLNSAPDIPTGYADNVSYSGTSPSSYSADPTAADINTGANTGGVDYGSTWDSSNSVDVGGGTDFSGFSGGGDFGGGGAGGDWGGNSNSQ
jgi:uncharacterized membrane protein YgcG